MVFIMGEIFTPDSGTKWRAWKGTRVLPQRAGVLPGRCVYAPELPGHMALSKLPGRDNELEQISGNYGGLT